MDSSLTRVSHGLWLPPDSVQSFADRVRTLLALCSVDAVAGGLTAALLHRLWLPDVSDRPVEVLVHGAEDFPRDFCASRRAELRVRRRRLDADEITVVDDIPVTTLARTWVDLAEDLRFADLVAAGDSALRSGASREALTEAVGAARRQRGVVQAREALPLLDERSRSRPETHLRCAVVTGRLPIPQVNVPIFDQYGQWLAEPDLSYDDVRLALEYNGADHAELGRMRKDITRELDLDDRGGWRTLVFGPAEVFGRPDLIAPTVRRARHEQELLLARRVVR